MDTDAKKDILNAIATLSDQTSEQIGDLARDTRAGLEKLDTRLSSVEDELAALSKTVDGLLEGDALGKRHITLTREEYDAFTALVKLPNRFAH